MADEEKKEEAPAAAAAPAEGDGGGGAAPKKSIFPILFMVINLACLGAGGFLTYKATIGWVSPQMLEQEVLGDVLDESENIAMQPIFYTLDPFTINLHGSPKRTIRLEVNLQMIDEAGFEEVISMGTEARDAIVRIINGKSFSELESLQGKLFLKEQIASAVNEFLIDGVVKDVYFTDFVVQ